MKKLILAMTVCLFGFFSLFSYAKDTVQNEKATDALSWLATVDKNEVAVSELAKSKTKDKAVKDFADMMIKAHGQNLKDVKALSQKLKIKLKDTAEVKDLEKNGKEDMKALKKLKGKEFDTAYANAMVKGHTAALNHLDQVIADADNTEVKDFLTTTREAVKMHLQHAEALAKQLS